MAGYRCEGCGASFKSVSGFDKHRTGSFEVLNDKGKIAKAATRRCMTEAEMRHSGLHKNENTGLWASEGPGGPGIWVRAKNALLGAQMANVGQE